MPARLYPSKEASEAGNELRLLEELALDFLRELHARAPEEFGRVKALEGLIRYRADVIRSHIGERKHTTAA